MSSISGVATVNNASPRWSKLNLVMLCMAILGEMCLAADFYGFAAVISVVSKNLKLSEGQAGLVQGIFGIAFGLGMLFWAPRGRKMISNQLYLIGLGGSGLLMLAQSYASSYAELLVLRVVIGFFDAAVWVGSMKIVMQWISPRRQGIAMGAILAAYSLAITLDFALGLPYAMKLGWQAFFFVLGLLTLTVGVIAVLVVRQGPYVDPHDTARHGKGVLVEIFCHRWIWICILGIFGAVFSIAATTTWIIPSFIRTQHLDPSLAPMVGTTMGLSQVAFLIFGGYLADRLNRGRFMVVGLVLTCLSAALCMLTTSVAFSFDMLMVVAVLSGIGVLTGGAIFSVLGDKFGSDLGPAAAGYTEMFGVMATFVAPAMMGALVTATGSFGIAFLSFVVVEALLSVAMVTLLCKA